MRKTWVKLMVVIVMMLLAACSGQQNESAKSSMDRSGANGLENKSVALTDQSNEESAKSDSSSKEKSVDRMVIYQANLRLRVKNFEKAQVSLETKANEYNGYIVQSNVYRDDNEQMSGTLILRIPQAHFNDFLNDAQGAAEEVLERDVSGQDVTEEYVDLESRLRSKRTVEERLLQFMQKAQKTDDLLKISTDLAAVQEEIETVMGRMKFLQNQTSLSTITISLFEENVIVPNLEKGELNTWEKTKKQLVDSTNFLLSALSGLTVFFIGNLPVLLLLALIVTIIVIIVKRKQQPKSIKSQNDEQK